MRERVLPFRGMKAVNCYDKDADLHQKTTLPACRAWLEPCFGREGIYGKVGSGWIYVASRSTRDLNTSARGTCTLHDLALFCPWSDEMIRTLNLRALRRVHLQHPTHTVPLLRTRPLFNLFKKAPSKPESKPTLSQDNLFHPFSESPFPALVARGEAIKSLAPCPVCVSHLEHVHAHTEAHHRAVSFECPDCGWPTHCTEDHWRVDNEHAKYCSRLREVNEDEHDLRSGRRLREFELPGAFILHLASHKFATYLRSASAGPQDTEAAISFSNWDVFWYTRNFPSMDTERSRRHASKLLTYPITIGSAIHQYSPLTLGSQRLTPEGSRSLAGA